MSMKTKNTWLKPSSQQLPDSLVFLALGAALASFVMVATKPFIQATAEFFVNEHKRIQAAGGPLKRSL